MSIKNLYSSTALGKSHIRLLHLHPSTDFDAPIKCTLNVVSLDPEPGPTKFPPTVYKALSYVWGDASEANKRHIQVNNVRLGVTPNLELAMRRLRAHHTKDLVARLQNTSGKSSSRPESHANTATAEDASNESKEDEEKEALVIWIDAICINQLDNAERANQVALMGRIYKSCSEVCVWLGAVGCEDVPACLDWDDLVASPSIPPPDTIVGTGIRKMPGIALGLEQCARNFATLALASFSTSSSSSSPPPPSSTASEAESEVASPNPTSPKSLNIHFSDLAPTISQPNSNQASSSGNYTTTSASASDLAELMIRAMATLSKAPYFTRAWVVQEAHLSARRTIYFGHISIPSTELWTVHANRKFLKENCTCCMRGEDPPGLDSAVTQFLGDLIRLAVVRDPVGLVAKQRPGGEVVFEHEVHTMPEMGILDFTIRRRDQDCRDPRDRVYAYLGIVEDWLEIVLRLLGRNGLGVEVDYDVDDARGESVEGKAVQLYLRLCCDAVDKGKSLEFLGWDTGKSTGAAAKALPSWALDWMHRGGSGETMNMFDCFRWKANKGIKFDAGIVDVAGTGKVLVSKASRRVDRIAKVGGLYGTTEEACENWHHVTGLREDPDAAEKRYPNEKDSWGDAWWKALCFVSENPQREWGEKDIRALELVNAIVPNSHWNYLPKMKISKACSEALPVGQIVQSKEMMADLFKSSITPITGEMALRLDGRVLFVTGGGYLGFGRAGVREGDELFLLGGCKTPLVMRRMVGRHVEESVRFSETELKGKNLYELVTGAFVYGIMDGELLEKEDELPPLETICVA